MTTSLFEEAVLEAQQLRKAAEDNATKTVVEAITPKIRQLIEKQILGEEIEDTDVLASALGEVEDAQAGGAELPDKVEELDEADSDYEADDEAEDEDELLTDSGESFQLNMESAKALMTIKESSLPKSKDDFENRVKRIQNSLSFGNTLIESHLSRDEKSLDLLGRLCDKMLNELRILDSGVIGIAGVRSQDLEQLRLYSEPLLEQLLKLYRQYSH